MIKKYSKRYSALLKLVDKKKSYSINEGIILAKQTSTVKFDSTIELAFKLNIDPRHADQQIRGALVLPCGTGKTQTVLVLTEKYTQDAIAANADFVGNQELMDKISKENWFDFDVIIASLEVMPKLAKLGRILGPKGLMPNPKVGTVTSNIKKAVSDIKNGKLIYRVDKQGNLHFILGKVSFPIENLEKNFKAIMGQVAKVRPQSLKGEYINNISISTSMGPGIKINKV